MANANIDDTIRIPKTLLTITGIWPTQKISFLYVTRKLITWSLIIALYFTMVIQVIHDLNNFVELSLILCYTISVNSTVIKMMFVEIKAKKLEKTANLLKNPAFSGHLEEYDFHARKAINECTILGKCYLASCASVVFLLALHPLSDGDEYPFPFPYHWGPTIYFVHAVGIGLAAWNNGCIDLLIVGFMAAAGSHFNILHEELSHSRKNVLEKLKKFEKLKKSKSCNNRNIDKAMEKELKKCVKHHYLITEYVNAVEDVFSFSLLIQFCGSIIVICNTGFSFVLLSPKSTKFAAIFTYFIAMMSQLAMYCWYGNEIILKSSTVQDACYEMEWYECSPKIRKLLVIIMQRSKRSTAITAFGYATLSLHTFGAVMQWSYSYFTVLNRMYSEERKKLM